MDAESLTRGDEFGNANDNLGGLFPYLYYVDATLCTGVTLPTAPLDFDDSAIIDLANITIAAGDLKKMEVIMHSNAIVDEQVGEEGGRAWKNSLEFSLEKNSALKLGYRRNSTNARVIFFVPGPQGIRIVGNDYWPAVRETASNNTNKKPEDSPAAGSVETWVSYCEGPAPLLDGTVADLEALLTP